MCENDKMTFEEAEHLIKRGDILSLRRELDNGLDPNLTFKYNCTLLMLTAFVGNTQIAELLISRGADVNVMDKHGDTALTTAAGQGFLPFVQLLLAHGAKPTIRLRGRSISRLMMATGVPDEKRRAILNAIKSDSRSSRRSFAEYLRSFLR